MYTHKDLILKFQRLLLSESDHPLIFSLFLTRIMHVLWYSVLFRLWVFEEFVLSLSFELDLTPRLG